MTIAGRRVLVTGGGSGAGASLALGFAAAGAAEVVICGRRVEALQATAARHSAIRALQCDVTDEASVAALYAAAGPVDIVIANAGQADSAPFAKTTLAQWNAMLAVNLTGVFLTFREGLRQMPGWGRLIAVSSTAGNKGYAKVAPYAAAKHGVMGLVRSLALEVARGPVTVNAICPSFMPLGMNHATAERVMLKEKALVPAGRLCGAGDVLAMVKYLMGRDSSFMSGQILALTGGKL